MKILKSVQAALKPLKDKSKKTLIKPPFENRNQVDSSGKPLL